MCVCHRYAGLSGGQKTVRSLGAGVRGGGEPPHVSAGNQTRRTLTRAASINHPVPDLMFFSYTVIAVSPAAVGGGGLSLSCIVCS